MNKLHSKNLNEQNIDSIIENEKIICEKLTKENEILKEKNSKIQKELLSYIEDNTFIYESDSIEDMNKYKSILISVIDFMDKLKIVDAHMKNETYHLLEELFTCIKEAILKQNDLCYLMKEDMNSFRISGKEELFRKNLLSLRILYEHNSILRAQITLFNKFKLKNENLIHADFEQLELKYKNLKTKEINLEKKIENLNRKIIKSTQKKLHYDEKSLYLEKLLNDKLELLKESNNKIKSKKILLNDLKKKKDESIKRNNEMEINTITKNVYEEFHEKQQYVKKLKIMLEDVKKKYESLSKEDIKE
ncbi:hypothetical protein PFAG_01785 [Plasmodium falciparum Santa Lucia]|uniref:Uncharacterized protein n=10 Tax=Plasmodium (Laverania) TaxID=418107 RepID=Q8IBK7_PLAF7|nr:conserved Plasmodium protein, unknown function [Plasmodium falciparum 3D7]ETW19255.1 hypothetical protein PFFVO_01828 [Plasmodium falciparum Vietnam Oak-Knoll (FVO)]ETW37390.1 hypothetical protein PFTANZ_01916 [Plasmodium falciparum Tanzania (2000708)]ETW50175.1 hypothetical protein PFMALIP_01863 [Plasmodium falciparum MaliPS096_E11]ETW62333.1 hypothetical protein PFMC_01804 [Plasmodium falciparum CAMP/Malaysia]EUR73804.1 hypothetical protein PFBG_01863 [Plasmodium falciparum 7G8]EUT88327.|eukprot:XP_001349147.1 conserved Plasmodium protein, unknown function [Plasmodium falciparum 3D7]